MMAPPVESGEMAAAEDGDGELLDLLHFLTSFPIVPGGVADLRMVRGFCSVSMLPQSRRECN